MLRGIALALVGLWGVLGGVVRFEDLPPEAREQVDAPRAVPAQDAFVQEEAAFFLRELRRLSESGIYETLDLVAIHQASMQVSHTTHAPLSGRPIERVQDGVFHKNTLMTVELSSPHLLEASSSLHDVIVMTDLDDGVKSFAIDEFPVMDEDAIEEFYERRVMEHK
jgi:hypothetical protein